MAGPGTAQERLDKVVKLIASNMIAEVCSLYMCRAGQVLELFASEGLNPSAVHQTRLRVGEGLVGEIAARGLPLNLSDAQSHPNYVYRPETGEEIYHSLMGVPILRNEQVIGVLLVQNRTQRHYQEDEVEAFQTVAMVMAEMVTSAELVDRSELLGGVFERGAPPKLEGLTLAEGLAEGFVVLHEPRVQISHLICDDIERENSRLETALYDLRASLDKLIASLDFGLSGEHREVIEAFRMFADDRGWIEKIYEAIGSGLTAEAAVQRVQFDTRARMAHVTDPYLRERLSDLEDLANRLIRHLSGQPNHGAHDLPDNAILVARTLGPADLLDYDRSKVVGVVLAEGSPTSHVTIVARALGIPIVGQVEAVVGLVEPGDTVIVDGDAGFVYVRPTIDVIASYKQNIAARKQRFVEYSALRDEPATTRDGADVTLLMNAGLLLDLPYLEETGAAGVGLFRTEFQFMVSDTFPRLNTQVDLYTKVLDAAAGSRVVFRTLDIGGDKVVPFMSRLKERNPALGWRATRLALDRPALLRYQVRALLQAAASRPLDIMFPLVADVAEFRAARAIVDREIRRMEKLNKPQPSQLRVGTMLEVPALAWQLKALLDDVDFISIGSNDLLQFLFACDRGNPRLSQRYDWLAPSVLSFIKSVNDACVEAGVPVSLCGEMAGRPLEAMCLIGLGLRTISMPPAAIGPVKMMVRSMNVRVVEEYLMTLLDLPEHSLRGHLHDFAQDHGIAI
ncbi:MAG: phosphoenolpyruvate--protein phosphotransferase [Sphingomonadales bacterium]